MKKLINDPKDVVDEAVAGFGAAHADLLTVSHDPVFVRRAAARSQGKVAIVSGGGSGHEPLHAGFVGSACSTPPCRAPSSPRRPPTRSLAATKAVDGGAGVLHIVKNYTGDVLNFETAADLAEAEGINVATVDRRRRRRRQGLPLHGRPTRRRGHGRGGEDRGRRGRARRRPRAVAAVAATDERGDAHDGRRPHRRRRARTPASRASRWPTTRSRSASASTASPAASASPLEPVDAIVDRLLGPSSTTSATASGDRVLLFVNGMGGTPLVELYIVFRRAAEVLAETGHRGHAAASWATTSRRSRCRACRSP